MLFHVRVDMCQQRASGSGEFRCRLRQHRVRNGIRCTDIVARHLNVDPRTLNRRLAREGLNYSAVLESVRKNVAVQHLRDGNRPLSDIAELVGFGSLSAFSSWFHHAFDCAPSTWRNAGKGVRK